MGGIAPLGEVVIDLLADTSSAEAGFARVSSAAEASTGKMKGLFDAFEQIITNGMSEAVKHVAEAVGVIVSKFVDAGMGANAAAESIAAGFDKLIGHNIVTPIVEATDKVKDFVLNLKNLSVTVPLSLGKFVELKDAIEHTGASSAHLPETLQTLTRNMTKAATEGGDAAKKFHELGISTDGWKEKMPGSDTMLVQIAEHIKNAKNPALEMGKATEVLGDHVSELMPLLQQGGDKVKALAEAHIENARVIEGSTQAFQHLQATESNLAEAMQNLLIPIFKLLGQVLDVILQVITKLIEWFTKFGHMAVAAGQLIFDYYKAQAKIMLDLFRPVFGWLQEATDALKAKLRAAGEWFGSMARAGLAAFTKVKDFIANQLQPVFKKIGEGVDWVVQKFNSLKEWIGRVKDAVFEMAKPIINTFQSIAKEVADFFHLHWGDVAKDAREAAKILSGDVQKVIDAAKGPAPVDPAHQFGGDPVAYVEQSEAKKTNVVKRGTAARQVIQLEHHDSIIHLAKDEGNQSAANWQQTMNAIVGNTKSESKVIGELLQEMPAPLVPALEKATSRTRQLMQSISENIANSFSSAISGMIKGTETLTSAFKKMGQQMLSNLESVLEKMLSQWLQHHIMELLIHTQTKQEEVGVEEAASAEKKAISMRDHMHQVLMLAKQTAISAWNALSKIPVIGPALGAAAAASTFAAVMAFGSISSAAGGFYEVDRDQLAMIHKKEMVLPAGIAERLRSAVGGDGMVGSGVSVNVYHNVNAIDAASFKDTIKQHSNIIGNEVVRVLKRKGLAEK